MAELMTFTLSKIFWLFAVPGNLLVMLILAGTVLLFTRGERWLNLGKRLCAFAALTALFITLFPVGGWLLRPLENNFTHAAPERVDGIIVIGSDEDPIVAEARGQPSAFVAASYFMHVAALAKKYPQAKLVFAGGEGRLGVSTRMTQAEVAREAMAAMGVPVERMIFEDKSRNTRENAVFAANIVRPQPSENWLLVTGAFHMTRAIGCFRAAGWNVHAAPALYFTDPQLASDNRLNFAAHLTGSNIAIREYIGLLAYWLLGYIDTPWPS